MKKILNTLTFLFILSLFLIITFGISTLLSFAINEKYLWSYEHFMAFLMLSWFGSLIFLMLGSTANTINTCLIDNNEDIETLEKINGAN